MALEEIILDVLFITPDSSLTAYQDLSKVYSAIEPPAWSLLLAGAVQRMVIQRLYLIVMLKD